MSFYQNLFFPNPTPSCIYSVCLYCIGNISNCSIKSCGRSWSAHESTTFANTKALLEEKCLSSKSCHFVKKKKFPNQTPSCICTICLHCSSKVSNRTIESCGRSWSAHKGTIHAYAKSHISLIAVVLSKKKILPNSFMHMFNVSSLYRQSIKLLP